MTTEQLLGYTKDDNRVCPKPQKWNELWNLLPDRERVGLGWNPPLPLMLAAWHETTDLEKQERLATHIRFAAEKGVLARIEAFITSLSPDDWVYKGEV